MTPLEFKQPVVEENPVEVEVEESPKTNGNKWLYALYVTILFLVVSMPVTYKFTNALLKSVCVLASKNGCPTMCGILVHTLVFLLLLRLGAELMPIHETLIEGKKGKGGKGRERTTAEQQQQSQQQKWKKKIKK